MTDPINDYCRPEGAPENWGVWYLSVDEEETPPDFVLWKGRHFAAIRSRGPHKGMPNWKAPRDKRWDRTGFMPKAEYKRLVAEMKAPGAGREGGE